MRALSPQPVKPVQLSAIEAEEFQRRLVEAVGAHVPSRRHQVHLPGYARCCFHEAAHALMAIETGTGIRQIIIHPDSNGGVTKINDINVFRWNVLQRSIIDAKISLAGHATEWLFESIDQSGLAQAVSDLAEATFVLQHGEYASAYFTPLFKERVNGWSSNDLAKIKEHYREASRETLEDIRRQFGSFPGESYDLRTRAEMHSCLDQLKAHCSEWVLQNRNLLLLLAADIARIRRADGRFGVAGPKFDRCVRRRRRE
jgi:hypothetical protein